MGFLHKEPQIKSMESTSLFCPCSWPGMRWTLGIGLDVAEDCFWLPRNGGKYDGKMQRTHFYGNTPCCCVSEIPWVNVPLTQLDRHLHTPPYIHTHTHTHTVVPPLSPSVACFLPLKPTLLPHNTPHSSPCFNWGGGGIHQAWNRIHTPLGSAAEDAT